MIELQAIISSSDILAAILSAIALILSIHTFRQERKHQFYADLDALYLEVLRLGVENPYLRDKNKTGDYKNKFSDDERLAYESYAYMVWNVCETIYDTTTDFETWFPVIRAEKNLHWKWFMMGENRGKFKREFRKFMEGFNEENLSVL